MIGTPYTFIIPKESDMKKRWRTVLEMLLSLVILLPVVTRVNGSDPNWVKDDHGSSERRWCRLM